MQLRFLKHLCQILAFIGIPFLYNYVVVVVHGDQVDAKPTRISGEKIEKYKEQLDKLQTIFEPMMNKVIVNFPTKK